MRGRVLLEWTQWEDCSTAAPPGPLATPPMMPGPSAFHVSQLSSPTATPQTTPVTASPAFPTHTHRHTRTPLSPGGNLLLSRQSPVHVARSLLEGPRPRRAARPAP